MKKTLILLLSIALSCVMCLTTSAQSGYSLKITVLDQAGPVIGATVLEKGTTNGTFAGTDGVCVLRVSSRDAVIEISSVGYTTQEFVAKDAPATVILEEDTQFLDDVVVIGYGSVKKTDLTGAVTAIRPNPKNKVKATQATDLLLGKVSGLQITQGSGAPGSDATIRIRQGASLNASNSPLIVIDGMPDASLSSLNSEDIESISVLKDASSSSIYGARGANGVIMVTTKKGPASDGKAMAPTVSYRGDYSLNYNYEYLDVYDADEFREEYAKRGFDTSLLGTADTDWQKEITRTAFNQKHTVTLRGALPYVPYRISAGYQQEQGAVVGHSRDMGTFSANFTPKFWDNHIAIDLGVRGTLINTPESGGSLSSAAELDPTQPVYGDYGSATVNGVTYAKKGEGYFMYGADSKGDNVDPNWDNVAAEAFLPGTGRDLSTRIVTNASLTYNVHGVKGLSAKVVFNGSFYNQDSKSRDRDNTPETWKSTNVLLGKGGLGQHSDYTSYSNHINMDYLLAWNRTFGKHSFDVTAGHSYESHRYGSWNGQNFYNDDTVVAGSVEESSSGQVTLSSYVARINYGFNNKYLFTAAFRADASSRFAPETRWGYFPSAAFAWKINEEPFLKGSDVSQLKLRLSYGQTGQQEIDNDYAYHAFYYKSTDKFMYKEGDNFYYTYRPSAYNRNIQWEKTTTYNVGIDYGFFNDRVFGSIDAYYRYTDNLLMKDVKVVAGSNFAEVTDQNIGEMSSRGVEFAIGVIPVSTRDWQWTINANIAWNASRIEKLTAYESTDAYVKTGYAHNNRYVQIHKVGNTPYTFYLAKQVYDEKTGEPLEKWYNPSYDPSDPNSEMYVSDDSADSSKWDTGKSSLAPFYGGFSTQLNYRNWDFGLNGHFAFGHYVFWRTMYDGCNSSFFNSSHQFPTNTYKDTAPYWNNEHYMTDYWLHKGDYLKIDNIVVGYTFSDLAKWLSSMRVSLGVQNVLKITSYPGLDPEVYDGIDGSSTPRPRMVMLSFDVTF